MKYGNTAVVQELGHHRYKFPLSGTGYTHTALVYASSSLQKVILVVDPYSLKENQCIYKQIEDICDDLNSQPSILFFKLNGFNIFNRRQQMGSCTDTTTYE